MATRFGPASLDLSVPGRVTVEAGAGGVPPLAIDGRSICVRAVLVHAPGTGSFSLLAEGAPLAWEEGSPDAALPREAWRKAAEAALDAAEGFLAANPGIARVADLAAIRSRISEIDEAIGAAHDLVDDLSRERESLLSRAAPLRRGLVTRIP